MGQSLKTRTFEIKHILPPVERNDYYVNSAAQITNRFDNGTGLFALTIGQNLATTFTL